jgi:type II secretory pathway component GspD/PulD (secretin)
LKSAFVMLLIALLASAAARAQQLQVIELHYRLADEVLPVLEPLLAPGGVLTGLDDKIFLRTTPQNEAQLRQALAVLDREPRQLLITVAQGTAGSGQSRDLRGAVQLESGDLRLGVNVPPGPGSGAAVQVQAGERSGRLDNTSSVRVLEGHETFISLGQSIPVTTTVVSPAPRGPVLRETTDYREVGTGFYATARTAGDRVILEVSPFQQRAAGRDARTVHTQSLATELSGRLGEWIPLGAVSSSEQGSERGMLVWGARSANSQYLAWVKVDEVP